VGFRLSMGKNYIHPTLCTINSRMYHMDPNGIFTELGFYNTGLLLGQSKITGRTGVRQAPLWDYYNEVVLGALDPCRATKRFIHYNRSKIDELTCKGLYNLFLPFERGGLGFNVPREFTRWDGSKLISDRQRRFAAFLESEFLSDPSFHKKVSLVTDTRRVIHEYERGEPQLEISSTVGPHARGLLDVRENCPVALPPLAEVLDPDRPELKVRYYSSSLIRRFKAGTFGRVANHRIFSWPYKVMERSLYRPSGEDPSGILNPDEYDKYLRSDFAGPWS
jgi:hypothetical protein